MSVAGLLEDFRGVDQLINLEARHGKAIEKLEDEVAKLKDRVARLEARQDVVVAEAKAAAAAAVTQVAIASISDAARRIGRLEERSEWRRLPSPE